MDALVLRASAQLESGVQFPGTRKNCFPDFKTTDRWSRRLPFARAHRLIVNAMRASGTGMMSPEPGDQSVYDDDLDDGTEASLLESSLLEEGASSRPGDRIWVGIRLRPQSQREREARDKPVWEQAPPGNCGIKYVGAARNQTAQNAWQFDRVFESKADNDEVYRDCAQSVVKASMEGFNGTGAPVHGMERLLAVSSCAADSACARWTAFVTAARYSLRSPLLQSSLMASLAAARRTR